MEHFQEKKKQTDEGPLFWFMCTENPPTGINIKNECELNAGDKDSLNVLKQDLNQINCLTKHSRRVLSR